MASGEKLPSLKICIDNESVGSDDDLSLTEEPDITLGEVEATDDVKKEQGNASDAENEVQFNVYLEKRVKPEIDEPRKATSQLPRRYENKEGDFVTGIDLTMKELKEKREERAKRFGMPVVPEPDVDLEGLYKSLGIRSEDLDRGDERGIRLEAVHVRGLSEMKTKDVFDYFKEFAAGGIEWIDDTSCNIVWMDKMTTARAMLKLSSSYDDVMGIKKKDSSRRVKKKDEEDMDAGPMIKEEHSREEEMKDDRQIEKMDDDDDLDLTEVKNKKNTEDMEDDLKEKDAEKKTDNKGSDVEEGELSDSDTEPLDARNGKSSILWPPGRWRLGEPVQLKRKSQQHIFLRFATKADIKLPGAEKRSKFYQKYGNPNYRGMRGLISNSMKRKIRNVRGFDDLGVQNSEPRDQTELKGQRTAVSYDSVDIFSDSIAPLEEEGMQLYSKATAVPETRKSTGLRAFSDEEEGELEDDGTEEEEEEEMHPTIEKVVSNDKEVGSDSDIDEVELERLLGRPTKKPSMKMYADEIEEKQKARRQQKILGGLTVVADAPKPKRVTDARQLIRGVDMDLRVQRDRDMRSKLTRVRDSPPDSWNDRPRSPEDLRSRFPRRMSPVTIRARLVKSRSKSPVDMRSRITRRQFRSRSRSMSPVMIRSRSPLMVRSRSPLMVRSRSPLMVRSRSPLTVRSRSPLTVRSRSPLTVRSRSPLTVRSRLNRKRSPVTMRSRVNRRRSRSRSPVTIRSRLNRSRSRSPVVDARAKLNNRNRNRRTRLPASESDSESSSSSSDSDSDSNNSSSSSSSSNSSSNSSSSSSSDSSSDEDSDNATRKRRNQNKKDLRGKLDVKKKTSSSSRSKYPSMKIEVVD